ncbi:aspartyl/glutamyl-tRNA(Asn/Gln) amidotransferase subunit C [Tahibacter aquaticus]|uniref:Aspartyl/glutamyl-tRNA(Asn/Gln) amidotransferase subunit C n=1 Tax=Tahibacter aquaticus TaxID=520092 RepID=A0A4R6ZB54_9GAMM|nr:Asp-tRNA(Asn)/Glu-tRNA(Gln) amidotransferase subunit GatC [Tahibacter aquaticus]TDR48939.1 aspartyl/glutamyl-tRNA(Asn/Gln) amidotransferase subunit C [Tahibacter aquaticus]
MSLDHTAVRHIARLARLAVREDELESLRSDLERVLHLFDDLAAANVDNLTPLAHPHDQSLGLRDDRVGETDRSEELLALAPFSQGGYYLVPKVIE